MAAKRRIGLIALIFFLGVILGSVVGELSNTVMPPGNVARELFCAGKNLTVGPMTIDLIVFTLTFGFSLKVNLISVLGIVLAALMLRIYA